jgi:thymidine kinase
VGTSTTHNRLAKNEVFCCEQVISKPEELDSSYEVLGFDEYQFFSPEMNELILRLVNEEHKIIICAGLQANYQGKKFGFLLDLIPQCDEIEHLKAICSYCHIQPHSNLYGATFTRLLEVPSSAEKPDESDQEIRLGDSQMYLATCRYHFQHNY